MEDVGVARSDGAWRNRRALVTGATGVVGSWLVKELLSRGASVVALIRDADPQSELLRSGDINRTTVVSGELEDAGAVARAVDEHEIDTIFHLGAQTLVGVAHRSPLSTWESNIRGTYNVLEAARRHGAIRSLVVASSDKAYGESETLPYTEDTPLAGRHPYEVSKVCAELLAGSYRHTYGLPVGIARCGNVYGGGDLNWSRIVPGTVRSLHRGERPVLRSDGTYLRDYLYVKDAARSYLCLADALDDESLHGEAFNFSTETPMRVDEMVARIGRLMGEDDVEPEIVGDAVGEIRDQHLDSSKAHSLLGWQPAYDVDAGLVETIDWYREFLG